LTDDRGEDLLKWFRAGFRAPTSVPPARAPESPASSQDCGPRWRALSVKFDRASSSWKTAHCLLSEDLPWSSVTLPKWGMMRAGELWERTTLVLPTSGTGAGLWPTPRARAAGPDFAKLNRSSTGISLETAVQMWPTPTSRDAKGGYIGGRTRNGKVSWDTLDVAVQWTDNQDRTGGQLNPNWVDWLIGFPVGHTGLDALETPKFQQWLRSHGVCSADQQDKEAA
jgi:hypothetical protein